MNIDINTSIYEMQVTKESSNHVTLFNDVADLHTVTIQLLIKTLLKDPMI